MPAFRDATPDDARSLSDLGKRSFTETFGHLYSAENLAAFLASHSDEIWREQLSSENFAVRVAEDQGALIGYAKLGPTNLPFVSPGNAIELRQFYILTPWQGVGLADQLMEWVRSQSR